MDSDDELKDERRQRSPRRQSGAGPSSSVPASWPPPQPRRAAGTAPAGQAQVTERYALSPGADGHGRRASGGHLAQGLALPEADGHGRRASGEGQTLPGADGHGRRATGRVRLFSPSFDPAAETAAGRLGARLLRFNTDVVSAVNELGDQLDALTNRVVGVEASHRGLADGTGAAFQEVLGRAQTEFGAQRESLTILRNEVAQEVAPAGRSSARPAMPWRSSTPTPRTSV